MTVQVYVTVLVLPVGPVSLLHVTPLTPAIDQVPVPVGVAPPVAPETVAVKVKLDPKRAVAELVLTPTVGVPFEIAMLNGVLGPAGR